MNGKRKRTIHSITGFLRMGGKRVNQYHDSSYGSEEKILNPMIESCKSFISMICVSMKLLGFGFLFFLFSF